MNNILGIVISYIYIFLIIILAKIFEKISKEASRKFIHIMLGNWWIIAMIFFDNVIWASIAPASFVIINYISYKKDIIQVMERDTNKQDGLGTVYYALSLLILSIIAFGILKKPEIGLVPVLVMAYGDGLAAIFGKIIRSKKIMKSTKSVAGSITMFIVSFIITAIYLAYIGSGMWIIKALILSAIVTILEIISIKGTDNLTVPLGMLVMMIFV